MATPFPSFTKTWHNTSYSSISPTKPALSLARKTVLITGGGSGIGARAVRSFAEARAANIAILGRRQANLDAVASDIRASFPDVKIYTYSVDMTDLKAVNDAFRDYAKTAGLIDILVSNAAFGGMDPPIKEAKVEDWWFSVETNVKGSFHLAQAFLSGYGKPDGIIINVTSGLSYLLGPGTSAYTVGKAAVVRLFGIVHMENPELRVVHVHPGVVDTEMSRKANYSAMDDASLPADFFVWISSSEAAFLNGKYAWVNWDVEELKSREAEIKEKKLLEMWLQGVPFES
ncbi:hypothetical protein BDV96DRAFT_649025 [Lophiotrema nucula]|uniref:NAD(P)-binding protein n=1 Tax=Lophiotrema nucula TaxID=690887 RepID=A0A6A5Z397_9PLEO|nr:hypothetical protein BDV96DRAFT_649025 [Lophiotrema nucula]